MNEKKREILLGMLSIVIPIIAFGIVFWRAKIYPFGDTTLVYNDMEYQYVDFFMWLHRVLEAKDSLIYSFNAGLGGGTVAHVAYYLASPLNILMLFAPIEKMAQFLSMLIVLKCSLCGLTAYVYMVNRFKLKNGWTILISTSYALMGYNIIQCSNIMWLDGVITLPILALGIYKLVNDGKRLTYYAALFYAIFSNWYMGYMLCIASVILFLCEMALHQCLNAMTCKEFLKKGIHYIIVSILAVLSSMFLFLPQTLQMMKQGTKTDWSLILQPQIKFSYLDGFRDLFLQNVKLGQTDTIPPIYIGSLVLLFCIMFFTTSCVDKKKKWIMGILLAGVMFLMCFQPTNLMFTGFKFPNNHYYRQSYIFSFAMIMVSGMYLQNSEQVDRKNNVGKAIIISMSIGLVYDLLNHDQNIYISLLMILVIGSLIWVISNSGVKNIIRIVACALMLLCVVNEFATRMQWEVADHTQSATYYTNYNQIMQKQVDNLDDELVNYRMDKQMDRFSTYESMGNESLAFGYSSISQYSSTGDYAMIDMLEKCGYGSSAFNLPYRSILTMDSLLGIKYIFSTTDIYGCQAIDSFIVDGIPNEIGIYENPYALPIAMLVDIECAGVELNADNPFANHETLWSELAGKNTTLYTYAEQNTVNTDGQSGTTWIYTIQEDGPLYVYLKNTTDNAAISINGDIKQTSYWYNNRILYAGEFNKGDQITIGVNGGIYQQDYGIQVATLNMNNLESVSQECQAKGLSLIQKNNGVIKANYTSEGEEKILLTIPYDDGWKVIVNGKEGKISKALGDFMTIPVERGSNAIVLTYHVPGLALGMMLSILAIFVFIVWEILDRRKKNVKKKNIIDCSLL